MHRPQAGPLRGISGSHVVHYRFLKGNNSHYMLTVVFNLIKRGRTFNHFLTVHWPWNACSDFSKLDFTVYHTHSLFLKHSLVLHKPVKWVSGDKKMFSNYIPSLNITADCLSSSSVFFPTKMRVKACSCVRRRRWRLCSFFKKSSLISELLDTHFWEIKGGFQILLYWNLQHCRDEVNGYIAIMSMLQNKSGSTRFWQTNKAS